MNNLREINMKNSYCYDFDLNNILFYEKSYENISV